MLRKRALFGVGHRSGERRIGDDDDFFVRLRVEIADLGVDQRHGRGRQHLRVVDHVRVARLRGRNSGHDGDHKGGERRERFHQEVLRTEIPAPGGEVSETALAGDVDEERDADAGQDEARQQHPDERSHQDACAGVHSVANVDARS